jgi:hypothetical protein
VALGARRLELDGDLHLHSLERVVERQVHVRLDVVAALAALALLRPSAAAAAEEPAEQVADVSEVAEVEVEPAAARTGPPPLAPNWSYCLRFSGSLSTSYATLDLLEARLRRLVAGVAVRMVLARELPIRLLDLVLRGVLRTPSVSYSVVIAR